jgi:uncharacterized protein (TIGR02996 family)
MNEDAFLAALHESPNDEVTWAALADWLDDDGQPQRAELVRLTRGLRASRHPRRGEAEARLAALLISGVRPAVPEVVNSIGMRLALIGPGGFRLGSPPGEEHHLADEKAREVEITRPYYLGVFPVTQAQFEAVMGTNVASFQADGRNGSKVAGLDTRAFPVDQASWQKAGEFCRRLSADEPGRTYRLPSEAEWEYAGRAGTTTAFHFGDEITPALANYDGRLGEGRKRSREGWLGRPSTVGSYPPNAFGLYDVHGNVMEWCSDWYDRQGYRRGPPQDPTGPQTGQYRAARGGCWYFPARAVRSASRNYFSPQAEDSCVGFRVAMVVG